MAHIVYNNRMEKNNEKKSHIENSHLDKDHAEKALRGAVITVVVITAFITTFTGSALNLSIPDIGAQFGASAGRMGWLVSGYTLSVAAFSVPFGRLADITSRRKVLIAGIALFVACCIAALASGSMAMLLISRVMQGVGAAMIFSTNTAVLISVFPGEQRGRALGYSLASTYVGLSAGPVIGGALNHDFGWRSIFVFIGILGVAALVTALMKLPAEKRTELHARCEGRRGSEGYRVSDTEHHDPAAGRDGRRNFDAAGNVIYMISIFLLMYGLSEAGNGVVYIAVAAAGAAAGVIFVRHEMKTADPVVDIRLFRESKGYAFSNLSAMLNYGATFAISYLISIYLQVVMGYSSQTAGLIMIFQPLIMALLSPVAGRLSDRFSPFRMSSLGMALCAAGTFMFIFTGLHTHLIFIIAALVVTGLGFAMFSSPNTNAVMSCVGKADYGVASSILATMRSIGHTFSMVIVTITVTVLASDMALADVPADVLIKVIRVSFIVFTVICIAGVFISLKRE